MNNMESVSPDNPFLALFEPLKEESVPSNQHDGKSKPVEKHSSLELEGRTASTIQSVNRILEDVFGFTINPYGILGQTSDMIPRKNTCLVFLESFALEIQHSQKGRSWLDVDILGQALFERLLQSKEDLQKNCLPDMPKTSCHAIEINALSYLGECFIRCCNQEKISQNNNSQDIMDSLRKTKEIIVQNTSTALREPEVFSGQDVHGQIIGTLRQYPDIPIEISQWLEATVIELENEGAKNVGESLVHKIVACIHEDVRNVPFVVMNDNCISMVNFLIRTPKLAALFVLNNFPKLGVNLSGRAYMDTLLGCVLSKSCLPTSELGEYDFFDAPSKQPPSVHNATEGRIWTGLEIVHEISYEIFNSLLRVSNEVKHLTLLWVGDCLKANIGRGKMWTGEMGPLLANQMASNGFMLNLSALLLRFCRPFCQGVGNPKVLKIDPTYTSVDCVGFEDAFLKNVHLRSSKDETFLLPSEPEEKERENVPESFNFVTDIFFLAHKSLDLGLRVCHEKFVKMNQELGRQQQAYREVMATGQGSAAAESIQRRMDGLMTKYLSMKAALLVPSVMENSMLFCASTGSWMVQLALTPDKPRPGQIRDLSFPLQSRLVPPSLKYVPEFAIENICENLLLTRRFAPHQFEHNGEYLPAILDFILTFMGSPKWVKNPHLRARLAESLENMLPMHHLEDGSSSMGSFSREQLFSCHPHRLEIVPTLLHVFVDIETTGQAVEFEMKFSYRRPMYDVMKYIWEMDEFKKR